MGRLSRQRKLVLGMPASPPPPGPGEAGPFFPGSNTVRVDPAKADSYSVAQIRSLIAYIESIDKASGLGPPSAWPGNIPQGESQHTSRLQIIQQYYAIFGLSSNAPAYPKKDPGEAQAGLGPTGLGIGSILDFLKKLWAAISSREFWLRALEVVLGLLLMGAGLAKLSGAADTVIKAIPVAGKVLT